MGCVLTCFGRLRQEVDRVTALEKLFDVQDNTLCLAREGCKHLQVSFLGPSVKSERCLI